MPDEYIKPRDAAAILGVTVAQLQHWRNDNVGPRYVRAGAQVRYIMSDIQAWKDELSNGYVQTTLKTERVMIVGGKRYVCTLAGPVAVRFDPSIIRTAA
jgi:predicted DNA-binding transcriptional regulator AlpA